MAISLRPSQALRLWQFVTLSGVRDSAPDLTLRQLRSCSPSISTTRRTPCAASPHAVGVTSGVTRALDTMGRAELVSRQRDEKDRRNVLVRRTVEGALYVERLGDAIIAEAMELPL